MNRCWSGSLIFGLVLLSTLTALSQPPPGKGPPGDKGPGGKDRPPRFEPGQLFPPGFKKQLDLSTDQQKQIAELEKEVKARLTAILTREQLKRLETLRPPRPKSEKPKEKDEAKSDTPAAGIQWFATWESGLREAQRTGRPILFVSAAPHCAGVSGIW